MKYKNIFILFLFFIVLSFNVRAEEDSDIEIYGLELEKVLNLGSGILATLLFFLTQIAYRRTQNARLKYVSIAFAIFAIKGFITSHELFFKEWSLVDPTASVLDFVILLVFFFGVIKR